MIRNFLMCSLTMAGVSFAQSAVRAPAYSPDQQVGACEGGAARVRSPGGFVGCGTVENGFAKFNGPVVRLFDSGKVEAVGQMKNGLRTGKWQAFSESGALISEVEFLDDNFHGNRIEYGANGQKKFHEVYVHGKREGSQTRFDVNGVATVVQYSKDRPVVASK